MSNKTPRSMYSVSVTCANCGVATRIAIAVGRHIRDEKCPTCGCRTLTRSLWHAVWRVGS